MTNPEVPILIQEARLKRGYVSDLADTLEVAVDKKNECLGKQNYEEAARWREKEVSLVKSIKNLLKK